MHQSEFPAESLSALDEFNYQKSEAAVTHFTNNYYDSFLVIREIQGFESLRKHRLAHQPTNHTVMLLYYSLRATSSL
ncbi:hypothetical protein E2C01_065955 [Portunus trituberculatus]|uniref:Uncharacterized protein n=1 Tax=Portunus trituberculatus TaxID=210409 RepID=A0A5B7HGY8_PORTR|nr:hypothetical protein [Portunus trituberculatus]